MSLFNRVLRRQDKIPKETDQIKYSKKDVTKLATDSADEKVALRLSIKRYSGANLVGDFPKGPGAGVTTTIQEVSHSNSRLQDKNHTFVDHPWIPPQPPAAHPKELLGPARKREFPHKLRKSRKVMMPLFGVKERARQPNFDEETLVNVPSLPVVSSNVMTERRNSGIDGRASSSGSIRTALNFETLVHGGLGAAAARMARNEGNRGVTWAGYEADGIMSPVKEDRVRRPLPQPRDLPDPRRFSRLDVGPSLTTNYQTGSSTPCKADKQAIWSNTCAAERTPRASGPLPPDQPSPLKDTASRHPTPGPSPKSTPAIANSNSTFPVQVNTSTNLSRLLPTSAIAKESKATCSSPKADSNVYNPKDLHIPPFKLRESKRPRPPALSITISQTQIVTIPQVQSSPSMDLVVSSMPGAWPAESESSPDVQLKFSDSLFLRNERSNCLPSSSISSIGSSNVALTALERVPHGEEEKQSLPFGSSEQLDSRERKVGNITNTTCKTGENTNAARGNDSTTSSQDGKKLVGQSEAGRDLWRRSTKSQDCTSSSPLLTLPSPPALPPCSSPSPSPSPTQSSTPTPTPTQMHPNPSAPPPQSPSQSSINTFQTALTTFPRTTFPLPLSTFPQSAFPLPTPSPKSTPKPTPNPRSNPQTQTQTPPTKPTPPKTNTICHTCLTFHPTHSFPNPTIKTCKTCLATRVYDEKKMRMKNNNGGGGGVAERKFGGRGVWVERELDVREGRMGDGGFGNRYGYGFRGRFEGRNVGRR